MKIVNEKGKLFGLINIVDLLVLVVVLLLAAAVVVKFVLPAASNAIAPESEMVVTLRIRGVMDYMKDQIKEIEPGSVLVAGSDYVSGTKVISIEETPYLAAANTDEGEIKTAADPQKYDIVIKFSAKQNKNNPIYKVGNQEVRVGRGFIFKTQTVEQNAVIERIEFING